MTEPRTITLADLKDACIDQQELFTSTFGKEAKLTSENMQIAKDAGLQVSWLVNLLASSDLDRYHKACVLARAEYHKVCAPARAEYDKACAPARAEYDKVCAARAEYYKTCELARAEYNKACAPARAEYDKVCEPLLLNALNK